jgi:uncharacterized protein
MDNKLEALKKEAKYFLEEVGGHHDWDHVERVYALAMHIGKEEGADLEIIAISAILHDIARPEEFRSKGKVCHAQLGAKMAKEILFKHGYDQQTINKVTHCIETHRYRNNSVPNTKEAKVLYDADKIDSLGAVGIGRLFMFAGEHKNKLHNTKGIDIKETKEYTKEDTAYREFVFKISKLKEKMLTVEGKRIAQERDHYMRDFFNRLIEEIEGKI